MEQYEGKIIRFIDSDGREHEGYIAGCEYDIGVTIVDNNDRDKYLYCLSGPSAIPKAYTEDSDYEYYNDNFEVLISMFKNGFYDDRTDEAVSDKYSTRSVPGASVDSCAFNK